MLTMLYITKRVCVRMWARVLTCAFDCHKVRPACVIKVHGCKRMSKFCSSSARDDSVCSVESVVSHTNGCSSSLHGGNEWCNSWPSYNISTQDYFVHRNTLSRCHPPPSSPPHIPTLTTHTHTSARTHARTHDAHTQTHACTHARTHACMHDTETTLLHMRRLYVCMHTCTQPCMSRQINTHSTPKNCILGQTSITMQMTWVCYLTL